jgi:RHS repeat-associated protein
MNKMCFSKMIKLLSLGGILAIHSSVFAMDFEPGEGSGPPTEVKDYGYNFHEANQITPDITTLTTDLFGDSIDPSSGSISFQQTDISIPGNSGLPVNITRTLSDPDSWFRETRDFENWSLSIPHVRSTYITDQVGNHRNSYWAEGNACTDRLNSNPSYTVAVGGDVYIVDKDAYWNGDTVSIPGHGTAKFTEKTGDNTYKRHNNRNWDVSCITNADGSDGFKITIDNGSTYHFNQLRVVDAIKPYNLTPAISAGQCTFDCPMESVGPTDSPDGAQYLQKFAFMLATKIEDRFGNWVSYEYDTAGKLKKITSNDNRTINVYYSGNRISSITANGKTWTYGYDDTWINTLSVVTRPDNKQWTFTHDKSSNISLWNYNNIAQHAQAPHHGIQCIESGKREFIELTHPEGMEGKFVLDEVCQGQSDVPKIRRPNPNRRGYDTYWIPNASNLFAISNKTLTFTDGQTYEWEYSYSNNEGLFRGDTILAKHRLSLGVSNVETADLKSTTKINPDNSKSIQYFDRRYGASSGNLMFSETYDASGILIRRDSFEYTDGHNHGSPKMYVNIQEALDNWTTDDIVKGHSASQKQLTTQHIKDFLGTGDTYTTTYSVFDIYDLPRNTHEFNDFNGKHRYTKQYYYHDTVNRLIGLPLRTEISSNGSTYTEVAKTNYHSATGSYKSLPNYQYEHGRWFKRNTSYHTTGVNAGLPNRVTYNGTNRWVYFSNYKRGKAQTIRTPKSLSTASQYAYLVVNDDGQVTKVTDFEGHCTNYGYTTMGRLSLIDPCDNRWEDTVIDYATTTGNEGLSYVYADMLKQTITRGDYEKVNYFDSLLRNRLSVERDKTSSSSKRYVRTDYDAFNRPTYQSSPWLNSSTNYGINTEYDALGRTLVVDDNTTTGTVSYTYLANNKVRVNDNKGNQTTTTYLAYGSPTQKLATYIAAPEATNTTLNYNIYGNITSIAQGGITEHRVYDGYQKLCKTTRPDVGNTAMVYNALNQVTWTAQGSSISNSTTSCDTSVTAADKATYAYDNLGNVKSITFSDASPDQTYTYDKNSKLTKLVAGSVVTDYVYNDAGLLEKETLSVDSNTFVLDYVFNSNGHLSNLIYPSGANIAYAPNALGQAKTVGTYATYATYHPNGAIKTHQYGNGISHRTNQNSSGLPSSTYDRIYVEDGLTPEPPIFPGPVIPTFPSPLSTAYKVNTDNSTNQVEARVVLPGSYTYAIDQAFTYDANNNLTFWDDKHNNSHDFRAAYDGLDRLDVITDSYSGTGYFNYDSMGNITNYKIGNKTLTYTYNSNKQLTKVNGFQAKDFTYDSKGNVTNNGENTFDYNTANQMVSSSDGTYVYDGNNKRVKKVDGQGTSYSMYSNAGQLVYRKVNGVHTDYYYLGKKLVAKKKGSTKTYIHTDFLGSPAAESNTLATVTSRLHYQPFGDTIEAAREDVGYTGHKFDKDLGLSYMQARYYDPVVGRFYSNDPVGFKGTHNFNRYTYGNNNPYKYIDPDGRESFEINVFRETKMWANMFGYENEAQGNKNIPTDAKKAAKQIATDAANGTRKASVAGLRAVENVSGSAGTGLSVATAASTLVPGGQVATGPLASAAGTATLISSGSGMLADLIEGSPQDSSRAGAAAWVTGKVAEKVAGKFMGHDAASVVEVTVKEATKPLYKELLEKDD